MTHPMLRLHDGFDGTSPELRDAVKELQQLLDADGFGLDVDGLFGRNTEAAVKRFQREQGLDDDGVVGPLTWAALLQSDPVFTTTIPPDAPGMLTQLAAAEACRNAVEAAADKYNVPACVIAGIASRECAWGLQLRPPGAGGTGDFTPRRYPTRYRTGPLPPDEGGFGRGLMQIDYDSHLFARTGAWYDAAANIDQGVMILANSRNLLRRSTVLTEDTLLRAAIAAYNSGVGNVLHALRDGRDVDFYTSGRNYSSDVINRAGWFGGHGWTCGG
jgi:peptidoglycan hydrolase-like protein with peptidoglycan-binding domain